MDPSIQEADKHGIHLEQFLKICGIVGTGGQAKVLIQSSQIQVNGTVETRRKRQLFEGDVVQFMDDEFRVEQQP